MTGLPLRSKLLSALAALALIAGSVLLYAERAVFDADRFADRAVTVLDDEAVSERLAGAITDSAISEVPNAVSARPLIESAAAEIVRSAALQSLIRGAVIDLHRTAIEGDQDTVTLTLADVGILIRQTLSAVAPQLADRVPAQLDAELVEIEGAAEELTLNAAQISHELKVGGWTALVVALVAGFLAVRSAPSRLAGVRILGLYVAVGAVLALIALRVGRTLLAGQFDEPASDAAAAIWTAFLGDLGTWFVVLGAGGLITTAGATSTREPLDAAAALRAGWARITAPPAGNIARAARAVALIGLGALVLAHRAAALDIVVIAIGALIAYAGIAELMRLTAGAVAAQPASAEKGRAVGRRRALRTATAGLVLLGAIAGAAALFSDSEKSPLHTGLCNGAAELCDRTLDQVTFPATHNSMSAATYPNWFFAQHEAGISKQLDAGIRGLLIDPHYGVATPRGIATDLSADQGSREKIEAGLGPEALAAVERIRGRIGYEGGGDRQVFLCHAFCEVGAVKAVDALRELRNFLVANPEEVVVVSVEDATTPEDTVAAFEDAGLTEFVYDGPNGPPWPTLGELIDAGTPLVVMAERDGGDPQWYRNQFEIVQETPFRFTDVAQLREASSCRPNRGDADATMLLINNWVDTSPAPLPTNARTVNQRGFLVQRARRCERERGLHASLLAVDFFREGDVVGAARVLNGLPPDDG